uniref:Uncharacterized protein n=1 Tax=Arundo donax TaxID=35708 RepID=A0A0A9FXH0_ARUDO
MEEAEAAEAEEEEDCLEIL